MTLGRIIWCNPGQVHVSISPCAISFLIPPAPTSGPPTNPILHTSPYTPAPAHHHSSLQLHFDHSGNGGRALHFPHSGHGGRTALPTQWPWQGVTRKVDHDLAQACSQATAPELLIDPQALNMRCHRTSVWLPDPLTAAHRRR